MSLNTDNWYAWIDTMPPTPDDFSVIGDVEVANPGVEPTLCVRNPQGINNTILLLDLILTQKPGAWPQVVSLVQARFARVLAPGTPHYKSVEIYFNGEKIAEFIDTKSKMVSGFIGLQVHSISKNAGPYEVRWRNIYLKDLSKK